MIVVESERRARSAAIVVVIGLLGLSSFAVGAVVAAGPGTAWTWGANGDGQLGNGSTASRLSPSANGLSDVVDLHGGREHVVSLLSNGTVRTWGDNSQGQIGDGTLVDRPNPTSVSGLTNITAVETGHYHSLALRADGSIWTWGYNAFGQLGDGTTTRRTTPVKVLGINDAVKVAAGRDMSYAIRADGTVWAWGLNGDGQLGDGTTTTRTSPVRVGSLTNVIDIAGGRDHGLAVRSNGEVWAWGWNNYAQIGDGTTVDRLTPVRVGGLGSATEVIAGAHHSYALLANGQVWSWGRNYRAELGDGTTIQRSTPVRVSGVSGAVAIGSGRDHGLAVLGDGTVRAWGDNSDGQLGDGTVTRRLTPVLVPGITGVEVVAGGSSYSVALATNGSPPANRPPTAVITASCSGLSCVFGSAGSSDPDGTIVARAWNLGDGSASGAQSVSHVYGAAGSYDVTLTVTDDDGATGSAATTVTVAPSTGGTVSYRAAASSNANTSDARVTVPGSIQAGDVMLLFATTNSNTSAATPSGWTLLGLQTDGSPDMASRCYTRVATAGDAGSTVSVVTGALAKTSLSLVAYRDAAPVTTWAVRAEPGTTAAHVTPSVSVGVGGSTVVSYWADKTSAASAWTLPGSVTERARSSGTGGGRIDAITGDTADRSVGTWAGVTATAAASAGKAVMWSVVVAPK